MVEFLLQRGVHGLYVCGSTGEGMSLTSDERRSVAEAYVRAAAGRVPVLIQVGHTSLAEARSLAAHAQQIGADAVSATAPFYFKPDSVETLIDSMAEVAAGAPELPFYYYHIPVLTGVSLSMVEFLTHASDRIENLAGLKYTSATLHEFQQCQELDDGRFEVLWGCDEMMLAALATGAKGAVGSTFNIAAPLYQRILDAFDQGDVAEARRWQLRSVQMVHTIGRFPFHPAMKEVLGMLRMPCGPCRLPQRRLSSDEIVVLRDDLNAIGFFDWTEPHQEIAPVGAKS